MSQIKPYLAGPVGPFRVCASRAIIRSRGVNGRLAAAVRPAGRFAAGPEVRP